MTADWHLAQPVALKTGDSTMFRTGLAAALIAIAAPAGAATTYDAFSSFNGTNPAGGFQYFSGGVPLTAPSGDCVTGLTGLTCLQTTSGSDGAGFYKSLTNLTLSTDGGTNNLHIINTMLGVSPGGTGAGVFFFAPTDGTYVITALFNAQDDLASGVTINAVQRVGGVVTASGVGSPNSIPMNTSFSRTVTLNAGDFFGFNFGPGSLDSHDLTAFSFSVSDAVPEPATWAMMLLGFAMIGVIMRRRPAASIAG